MDIDETTARTIALIEHLGGDRAWGWKSRVAERLGLAPQDVTMILKGRRRVALGRAIKLAGKVGLDARYFTEPVRADATSWLGRRDDDSLPPAVRGELEKPLAEIARQAERFLALDGAEHPRAHAEAAILAHDLLTGSAVRAAQHAISNPGGSTADQIADARQIALELRLLAAGQADEKPMSVEGPAGPVVTPAHWAHLLGQLGRAMDRQIPESSDPERMTISRQLLSSAVAALRMPLDPAADQHTNRRRLVTEARHRVEREGRSIVDTVRLLLRAEGKTPEEIDAVLGVVIEKAPAALPQPDAQSDQERAPSRKRSA